MYDLHVLNVFYMVDRFFLVDLENKQQQKFNDAVGNWKLYKNFYVVEGILRVNKIAIKSFSKVAVSRYSNRFEDYKKKRKNERHLFRRKKRKQEKREREELEVYRCRNDARKFYQRLSVWRRVINRSVFM